jgi:hypothetical protein
LPTEISYSKIRTAVTATQKYAMKWIENNLQ